MSPLAIWETSIHYNGVMNTISLSAPDALGKTFRLQGISTLVYTERSRSTQNDGNRLQTDILYINPIIKSIIMKQFLFLFLFIAISCKAQNTLSFEEGTISPKTDLSEIAWMEGHWKGEAFGGITEEIWSPPLGASMMFSFKLVVDDKVAFYELGHIRQLEETLVFELKHFGIDLKAWEEKDEVQSFKLIKVDGNHIYFDGFTFEKVSDDEINIYGLIHQEDGKEEEVKFNYKKQDLEKKM